MYCPSFPQNNHCSCIYCEPMIKRSILQTRTCTCQFSESFRFVHDVCGVLLHSRHVQCIWCSLKKSWWLHPCIVTAVIKFLLTSHIHVGVLTMYKNNCKCLPHNHSSYLHCTTWCALGEGWRKPFFTIATQDSISVWPQLLSTILRVCISRLLIVVTALTQYLNNEIYMYTARHNVFPFGLLWVSNEQQCKANVCIVVHYKKPKGQNIFLFHCSTEEWRQ